MSANKPTPHPNGTSVPNSLGTKVPHPHAESMLLYAQDAMETDRPWERWECSDNCYEEWGSLTTHPMWGLWLNYRRKPRTILINGIEVPEPYYGDIDVDQDYFGVDPTTTSMVAHLTWGGDSMDKRFLERGLIHLTEENARKHAEALLSFTKV